jgi:hypothetical protein
VRVDALRGIDAAQAAALSATLARIRGNLAINGGDAVRADAR